MISVTVRNMSLEKQTLLEARITELEAENARLLVLEKSVLDKAKMLREGGWHLSDEEGAAGELHAAITGFWIDYEEMQDDYEKRLKAALGEGPAELIEA